MALYDGRPQRAPLRLRRRRAAAQRRPLHDDETGTLQVLRQTFGDDRRHHFRRIVDSFAAAVAKRECDRIGDLLGRGGGAGFRAHGSCADIARRLEQNKNKIGRDCGDTLLNPIQPVSRCALPLARNARVTLRLCRMHSETALALVTRKHVNRRERRAADPDRTREFCLSQGGILCFRIYSLLSVIPLLFPCYGGRSSPVRVEFNACSLAGERGFSAISHPCGFRMRRGKR